MPRLVLDTNVLVSAFLTDGNARLLMQRCLDGKDILLQSNATLEELARVLRRPKLHRTADAATRFFSSVIDVSEMVSVRSHLFAVAADPDDDRFLELAVDGNADAIVSGDHHLLELETFRGIPIWMPAVALSKLSS